MGVIYTDPPDQTEEEPKAEDATNECTWITTEEGEDVNAPGDNIDLGDDF